ncbi:cyd operon protein YbgT [Enhydrobacter aerosaccus]|uniref:Cyd operon protein YbgT n=1 Tax=Enhydrobacter aerosaccus TaxID=225324 RepID=A0A1T4TAW2_9HYPH|nr:cytochrome bd-I oxidase subunit CydX [Enhydrobacter aerosaccus]SKA37632.1 cyd operon protein YbgT [Enhydrobacter aerosaccus]
MWYFAWVLGLGLACTFAILNAMWLELDPRYTSSTASHPADAGNGNGHGK